MLFLLRCVFGVKYFDILYPKQILKKAVGDISTFTKKKSS